MVQAYAAARLTSGGGSGGGLLRVEQLINDRDQHLFAELDAKRLEHVVPYLTHIHFIGLQLERVANGLTLVVGDGRLVTWRSALGQSATAAALLTVGGRVTWQSALGQSATAAAILTVGGRVMAALIAALLAALVAQSALGQSATASPS